MEIAAQSTLGTVPHSSLPCSERSGDPGSRISLAAKKLGVGLLIQGRVGVVGQVTTFYNRQCVIPFASINSHTVAYSMLNSMNSITFVFPLPVSLSCLISFVFD